ncbi:YdgA family protein [Aestuariibacter halophilus]|uniref:YdgA family protein n=1 Tax=Fluctibacter halophilus TaxID=226011 RepID=A0ABS8G9Y6_9ALTE|nr:DUF945 family protein [Aestuariibacter halophilus]MCC2616620.1 YdgA family protein [Aestuariibacter halophilus]
MKKALIGGFLVVLAIAITPLLTGYQARLALGQGVTALSQQTQLHAVIDTVDAQWRHSYLTFNVTFSLSGEEPLHVPVKVDLQHGPVLSDSDIALSRAVITVDGDQLRDTLLWDKQSALYTLTLTQRLDGSLSWQDTLAPFTFSDDSNDTTLAFSGYQGSGRSEQQTTTYRGHSDVTYFRQQETLLALRDMNLTGWFDSDMPRLLTGGVVPGEFVVQLGKFDLQADPVVQIDGLQYATRGDVDISSDRIDMTLDINADRVTLDRYEITDMALQVSVKNLMQALFDALKQRNADAALVGNSQPMQVDGPLREALLQQLQRAPTLAIPTLTMNLPEGQLSASGSATVKDVIALPQQQDIAAFWYQHLVADAQITTRLPVARALARHYVKHQMALAMKNSEQPSEAQYEGMLAYNTQMLLDGLVQQGLLQRDEENIKSEFSLQDGEAILNGNRIPLPAPSPDSPTDEQ